jgi:hypothetical protein
MPNAKRIDAPKYLMDGEAIQVSYYLEAKDKAEQLKKQYPYAQPEEMGRWYAVRLN